MSRSVVLVLVLASIGVACGLGSTGTGENIMNATGQAQGGSGNDGGVVADSAASGSGAESGTSLLTLTSAKPPATADLTMLGTLGFTHWGRTAPNDVNNGAANVAPFGVTMESLLVDGGSPMLGQFGDNRVKFSWQNGTPVANEPGTTSGIYSKGAHASFVLTFVADTIPHQVLLFVGGNLSHAQLTARLGTGAGQRTVTDLQSNPKGTYDVLYTIDYAASTVNEPLVVSWEMLVADDTANGNVSLSAVAIR